MLVYNITDKENSIQTIELLTGIKKERFFLNLLEANVFNIPIDDVFNNFMSEFQVDLNFSVEDLMCRVQHITTSGNECKNIVENGLNDLKSSYLDKNSEIRIFLDNNRIKFDIDNEKIIIKGREKSIHYTKEKSFDLTNEEEKLWSIGRKFYFDFCVCGFYSIDYTHMYGGNVHRRPEIIYNIDELIHMDLEKKWENTHKPFIVEFNVPLKDIAYLPDDEDELKEDLLREAINNSLYDNQEKIVLLKNGVNIPPNNIVAIRELKKINNSTYSL